LEFWASSESDAASYPAIKKVQETVEPVMRDLLRGSRFEAAKLLLRYVPVVMPPELLDRYPPRSKARLKQRILECAPQLQYEPFVRGSFTDQVRVYVDGIRTASSFLPKFGLSLEEVRDFEGLLTRAIAACIT
jgi:hypothetical protein